MGSAYCVFHIERLPIIYGAIMGAILSLFVSQVWGRFVPSVESTQLTAATRERDKLLLRVGDLQSDLQAAETRAKERSIAQAEQIERLEARLEPFLTLAAQRFPELPQDVALEKLQDQLRNIGQKVEQLAAPPVLTFAGAKRDPNALFSLTLYFETSKATPLGVIKFRVDLPAATDATLLDISPAGTSMDVRTAISSDKHTGTISFELPSIKPPVLELQFSAPTAFTLRGSHDLGTLQFSPE